MHLNHSLGSFFLNGGPLKQDLTKRKKWHLEDWDHKRAFNLWNNEEARNLKSKALSDTEMADNMGVIPWEDIMARLKKKRGAAYSAVPWSGSWATKRSKSRDMDTGQTSEIRSRSENEEMDFHFSLHLSLTDGFDRIVANPDQSSSEIWISYPEIVGESVLVTARQFHTCNGWLKVILLLFFVFTIC